MIKRKQIAVAFATVVAVGSSWSQSCPCGSGTAVTDPATLATLLGGKTVCAALGDEVWQEFHTGNTAAGGPLIDYKRGPSDAVDPTKQVGTWAVDGVPVRAATRTAATLGSGATVRYDYGTGGVYSYTVCQTGLNYNFCGARNITGATLLNGQVPCGAAARKKSAAR